MVVVWQIESTREDVDATSLHDKLPFIIVHELNNEPPRINPPYTLHEVAIFESRYEVRN